MDGIIVSNAAADKISFQFLILGVTHHLLMGELGWGFASMFESGQDLLKQLK